MKEALDDSPRRVAPTLLAWGTLTLVVLVLLGAQMASSKRHPKGHGPLPIHGIVPDVTLIQSTGQEFSFSALKGRVWVATLFFTHCDGTCPMMASQMAQLQETIGNSQVALVSISVDPERDTVDRLKWYSEMVGAKEGVWYFVTGDKGTVVDLAENHFKLGTGLKESSDPVSSGATKAAAPLHPSASGEWEYDDEPPIAEVASKDAIPHSTRFALVDREGRIRGYYDGLDEKQVERLRADADILLKEEAKLK
jgi:protein SCO1/2